MKYLYFLLILLFFSCGGSDLDSDGIEDSLDAFPNDPAASVDTDGDGYPDFWNEGMSAADSISDPELSLDEFPKDANAWVDVDGDGVPRFKDEVEYTGELEGYDSNDADAQNPNGPNGDEDADGVSNKEDAFPNDPAASLDTDNDGYPDSWNEGMSVDDSTSDPKLQLDAFPTDSTEWLDSDGDGYGDNEDDKYPDDPTEWLDRDGDGYGDNEDDAFPNDPTEWLDSDGDGFGDNDDDAFPRDPAASIDGDGDGYPNSWNEGKGASDSTSDPKLALDEYPNNANAWIDGDGDGVPRYRDEVVYDGDDPVYDPDDADASNPYAAEGDDDLDGVKNKLDAFPLDPSASEDSDRDGYPDKWNDGKSAEDSSSVPKLQLDAFPTDNTEWLDTDHDGYGDNSDVFPTDPTEWLDTDNDGLGDNIDAFPNDPTEWLDTDNDGFGDNSDAFPTDPAASNDTDGDGYPNSWNDGKSVADSTSDPKLAIDAYPHEPTEWADTDGDGMGDNADEYPRDASATKETTYYSEFKDLNLEYKTLTTNLLDPPKFNDSGYIYYIDFSEGKATRVKRPTDTDEDAVAPHDWDIIIKTYNVTIPMGPMSGDGGIPVIQPNTEGGVRYYMDGQLVEQNGGWDSETSNWKNIAGTAKNIDDVLTVSDSYVNPENFTGYGHPNSGENWRIYRDSMSRFRAYKNGFLDWVWVNDMMAGTFSAFPGRVFVYRTTEGGIAKMQATDLIGLITKEYKGAGPKYLITSYKFTLKYHYGLNMDGGFSD